VGEFEPSDRRPENNSPWVFVTKRDNGGNCTMRSFMVFNIIWDMRRVACMGDNIGV
jgi:hypothetical protein